MSLVSSPSEPPSRLKGALLALIAHGIGSSPFGRLPFAGSLIAWSQASIAGADEAELHNSISLLIITLQAALDEDNAAAATVLAGNVTPENDATGPTPEPEPEPTPEPATPEPEPEPVCGNRFRAR